MTVSTCMYYTGLDPKTKKPIYVPYTYSEKKEQKRILEIPMAENRQRNEDYKLNEPKTNNTKYRKSRFSVSSTLKNNSSKSCRSRHPQRRFKVRVSRKR